MPGPDHAASLEPTEFKEMTQAVREVELATGGGIKSMSKSEQRNRSVVRKSIYIGSDTKPGEAMTRAHLRLLRPASGLEPGLLWEIEQTGFATRHLYAGQLLDRDDYSKK
jgi:sialic acid synthase SpsE